MYASRKGGGIGLLAIEDCVELAVRGLKVHVHVNRSPLVTYLS